MDDWGSGGATARLMGPDGACLCPAPVPRGPQLGRWPPTLSPSVPRAASRYMAASLAVGTVCSRCIAFGRRADGSVAALALDRDRKSVAGVEPSGRHVLHRTACCPSKWKGLLHAAREAAGAIERVSRGGALRAACRFKFRRAHHHAAAAGPGAPRPRRRPRFAQVTSFSQIFRGIPPQRARPGANRGGVLERALPAAVAARTAPSGRFPSLYFMPSRAP